MLTTIAAMLAIFALVALVTGPLLTLAHEFGHALVPWLRAGRPVRVWLGRPPYWREFRLGRLTVGIAIPSTIFGGYQWEGPLSRPQLVATFLLGPVSSAACAVLLLAVAVNVGGFVHHLLVASALFAGFQAAFTIVPMRYPSWLGQFSRMPSDGMRALEVLLRKHA